VTGKTLKPLLSEGPLTGHGRDFQDAFKPGGPGISKDGGEFSGLFTMSNSVSTKSASPTIEDLIKAVEEFPKYADEQMAKHEEFIKNQSLWEHVIGCERLSGRTDRMKQLIMNMRLGAPCRPMSYGYSHCYLDQLKTPRFTRLRKRLFKAVFK